MYSPPQSAIKYLEYYFTSSNGKGHGIHSPFVFDFTTKVLNDKTDYPAYNTIENLRNELLNDKTELIVEDLGAGSSVHKTNQRTVSSIVKNSAKTKKYGQLIFRIAKKYQTKNILELGTSLGITTSYLAIADAASKVITLEGSKPVAEKAKNNFRSLNLSNIELIEGNFDDTLSSAISHLPAIDLAFIDGNHRKEPTIKYFNTILSKTHDLSIVILDDIHWSKGMEEAWKYCKDHEAITLSIDLFFIGILFFRKEVKEKQHFSIRF